MARQAEKIVRSVRLKRLANGNVQIYGKQRSKQLAAIGIKHGAWRLAFELSPALIIDLQAFINETSGPATTTGEGKTDG